MDLAVEKIKLICWLAEQDEEVIGELVKWKQQYTKSTIEEYNQDLDRAESAIRRGDYVAHDEAVKIVKSWREK